MRPLRQRERTIARAERGNALNWTGMAAVGGLGSSFLSADLFNTVLMRLGATDFVLGLFALNQIISLPSQFVAARVFDRTRNKVRVAWLASAFGVLPVLLPLLLLAFTDGQISMWVFFSAVSAHMLISHVAGAFGGVAQMDLLSRVLRRDRRGTLFGFQGSLGGLAGILGGLALAGLMGRLQYPERFISAWSLGLVLSLAGGLLMLRLRQLPGLRATRQQTPGLRQAFAAIAMVSAPAIGWLADRWGRGPTALAFSVLAVVGFLLFPYVDSKSMLFVAYALIGVGTSGITMPLYLSVIDLSPTDGRGFYVAVRYGTESAVYMLFLPLAGFVSTNTAPHVIFYSGAAFAALAGFVLFRVAERRLT